MAGVKHNEIKNKVSSLLLKKILSIRGRGPYRAISNETLAEINQVLNQAKSAAAIKKIIDEKLNLQRAISLSECQNLSRMLPPPSPSTPLLEHCPTLLAPTLIKPRTLLFLPHGSI